MSRPPARSWGAFQLGFSCADARASARMVEAAKTIRTHLAGVLEAATSGVSNAVAEAINSRIQMTKQRACGFRNRERFRNAVYFHLGGFDLYPRPTP